LALFHDEEIPRFPPTAQCENTRGKVPLPTMIKCHGKNAVSEMGSERIVFLKLGHGSGGSLALFCKHASRSDRSREGIIALTDQVWELGYGSAPVYSGQDQQCFRDRRLATCEKIEASTPPRRGGVPCNFKWSVRQSRFDSGDCIHRPLLAGAEFKWRKRDAGPSP
jgi:hypothetical protein